MNNQLQCKELREGNTVLKDDKQHTVTRRDLADGSFVGFRGLQLTESTSLGALKPLGFTIRKSFSGVGYFLYFLNEHVNANRPLQYVHQLENIQQDLAGS
jgi:hypothetical protein